MPISPGQTSFHTNCVLLFRCQSLLWCPFSLFPLAPLASRHNKRHCRNPQRECCGLSIPLLNGCQARPPQSASTLAFCPGLQHTFRLSYCEAPDPITFFAPSSPTRAFPSFSAPAPGPSTPSLSNAWASLSAPIPELKLLPRGGSVADPVGGDNSVEGDIKAVALGSPWRCLNVDVGTAGEKG